MDYKKHYNLLIERAKGRILSGYSEKHHIIPRCMGGSDESSNLVALTGREHYIAHQLLIKIYPEQPKLVYAARMMTYKGSKTPGRSDNKLYEWLRTLYSEKMREEMTGRVRNFSLEHRANISKALTGKPGNTRGKKLPPRSEQWKKQHSEKVKGLPAHNKGTGKQILCVELNKVFKNAREAADFVGLVDEGYIRKIASDKTNYKTAKGYRWQFVDDEA